MGELRQFLDEEGVSATYNPPYETKELNTAMAVTTVVLQILDGTGATDRVRSAVEKFLERFSRSGASISGLPEEEVTLEKRLARVDQLLESGTIDDAEHFEQRARILDEI